MRRTPQMSFDSPLSICPECDRTSFYLERSVNSLMRCRNCDEPLRTFRCLETSCKFHKRRCLLCSVGFKESEKNIKPQADSLRIYERNWDYKCMCLVFLSLLIAFIYYNHSSESSEDKNVKLIKQLKTNFPSQKNETWFHLLSVLEQEIPSVKSITLLYGEDKKTSNCLTNEIVSLYTTDSKIKMEEITFSTVESEVRDYGFFLEHYHEVVKKFRVLVTDLSKVSGNIARVFHSLCDEVSSDIKPSLFIFTLKYDKKTANIKPLERAVITLKEAWRSLPHNEITPLLSRIVKNVVDVVPEGEINC